MLASLTLDLSPKFHIVWGDARFPCISCAEGFDGIDNGRSLTQLVVTAAICYRTRFDALDDTQHFFLIGIIIFVPIGHLLY